MKLRAAAALLLPLALALTVHASSSDSDADSAQKPTLLDETLGFLHLKHHPKPATGPAVQTHQKSEVQLALAPEQISLSRDHEIQATVTLYNRSKKYIDLNFPTSQRIEILVIDSTGKVVNTWSDDQSFTNDPASITVNPQERLQYVATVATREMSAGQPYIVQASFPNYPALKVEQKVIPRP